MDHASSAVSREDQAEIFKVKLFTLFKAKKYYSFQNADTFILRDSIFL